MPAAGYYEWQRTGTGKVPYFLHDPGGALLSFAGWAAKQPLKRYGILS